MLRFARALVVFLVVAVATGAVPDGAVAQLRARGVTATLTQVSDGSVLLTGGAPGGALRGLVDVGFEVDLDELFGAGGASLFVQHQAYAGRNGSTMLGDVQGFSNIDAEPFAGTGELWLQQVLAGELLRMKLGRVDVASEFAATANAAGFLNSSLGLIPVIAGAPTYPEPAAGALARVATSGGIEAGAGAFAVARGLRPDFMIGELALARAGARLALGAWQHAAERASAQQGWYAMLDARLLARSDGAGGLDAFAQAGICTAACDGVRDHGAVGVVARELMGALPIAEQGLAVSWVRLGAEPRPESEWVVEAYAAAAVTDALRLQLDVQRIQHSSAPGRYGITLRSVLEL